MNTSLCRDDMFHGGARSHSFGTSAKVAVQSTTFCSSQSGLKPELQVRLEERRRERSRIARELHDTLFQGFFSASYMLGSAADQLPENSASRLSVDRARGVINGILAEARTILQGLRSSTPKSESLEQSLSAIREEFAHEQKTGFRVFVNGQPRDLQPNIIEQIYLIGREALLNAVHHSGAANIEAEVEYLPRRLRLRVRDNGRGIDPQILKSGRDSHWGLLGMQERAANIGAKLRICSRLGQGTEVELSVLQ